MTGCALELTRGVVCNSDPRACKGCIRGAPPAPERFVKRNWAAMQRALIRARRDRRRP